ncbi:glycosyltransferase family 4 protein [Erysipelothrix tonsillarum]|uniref:glycosyltransferase family 4 protein n=1 Tax=Erysipelothrix tonsillarum TaxID=38402 RepID=UPI00037EA548|nr:glycosyltransferase [Erysipelothrix tonsillarum]
MKILLYQKGEKAFSKSGIGRAMKHQIRALTEANVDFTTDIHEPYDLVHINTVDLAARAFARKARRNGKKVVYHAHSTEEDFRNSFVFSNQIAPLFKKHIVSSYKLGDFILTPTPYSKRILEDYGITIPIEDISNGIDLSRFDYDEKKVAAYRDYFKIQEGQRVVVSVGLYFERKGLPDFMEVARAMPDVTFIWFGHTPLASVTAKVRDAIKNKPSNVILPGYIAGDIIEGAYMSADMFFFPSYEETEGIVVLEALAARCQTLVRDIGVYDPWLIDGENCYKGDSNQAFIRIIRGCLDKTIPSTTDAGYHVAEKRSIGAIGEKLKAIYQKVLNQDKEVM